MTGVPKRDAATFERIMIMFRNYISSRKIRTPKSLNIRPNCCRNFRTFGATGTHWDSSRRDKQTASRHGSSSHTPCSGLNPIR